MDGPNAQHRSDPDASTEMVTFRVTHLANKLNAQSMHILQKHSDLKLVEWRVLRHLKATGDGDSIMNLSVDMEIDKGQLSRTVKRMAEKDLVSVSAREDDHRTHIVRMTDAGLAAAAKVERLSEVRQSQLVKGISAEDLKIFMRVLETINNAADVREFPELD